MSHFTRRAVLVAVAMSAAVATARAQDTTREDALRFDRHAKAVIATFTPARESVAPTRSGGFSRIDWTLIRPATVDVKRTDSLTEPVVAVVAMTLKMAGTRSAPTEEEAKAAEAIAMDEFRFQATFVPTAGGWAYKTGGYTPKSLGKWFEIQPEELRVPKVSPLAAVVKLFELQ